METPDGLRDSRLACSLKPTLKPRSCAEEVRMLGISVGIPIVIIVVVVAIVIVFVLSRRR
jgi:hypothetical protein